MMARQWEAELNAGEDELPQPPPRLREPPSPIGQLLGQNLLDEAVRALQEDLAMLQAEQERGLVSINGTLEQIGQELSAVRAQLIALTEPILSAQASVAPAGQESEAERERERDETELRFERLE